jgi:hypothetical protein
MKPKCIYLLFTLVLISLASAYFSTLKAQNLNEEGATLAGWFNELRLFSMDRSNNSGGFFYDRGLFRMHTPEMSPEYEIDLFTYGFTPDEDYDWYKADSGFRSTMGSLNTLLFAAKSELKHKVQIKNGDTFSVEAHQQKDLRTNRGLFIIGYRKKLLTDHSVAISHTLGKYKTDLDATFRYIYENNEYGRIAAEVTIMDWANNIVSGLSESRRSEYETRHLYNRKPVYYSLYVKSPDMGRFRGELFFGIQKQFEAEVSVRELPDQNYLLEESFNLSGALAEVHFEGGFAGLIYQHYFVKMTREPAANSLYELDYGNRQEMIRGGAYFSYRWKSLGLKQWLWIARFSDDQYDNNPEAYVEQDPNVRNPDRYPFTFNELRTLNKTQIYYHPGSSNLGFFAEYNADWRDPAFDGRSETIPAFSYRSYYRTHINSRNERFTAGIHIYFSSNAQLTLGASVEIDRDRYNGFDIPRENFTPSKFDGGFGRLRVYW